MNDSQKVEYLMRLYGLRPVFAVLALAERDWNLLEASRYLLDGLSWKQDDLCEETASISY